MANLSKVLDKKTEHYPIIIKLEAAAFFTLLFLVLKIAAQTVFFSPQSLALDLTAENILNSVNRERDLRNVLLLNSNGKLGSAAQFKAQDMINRRYFAHIDPDGNYIWPKIVAQGYAPYLQLGENLAIEFYNTDSLVQAWMNSPTHRANILNENFRDQGMGLAFGQNGQYYSSVANTFGTLLNQPKPKAQTAGQTATPALPLPPPKVKPLPPKPSPPLPAPAVVPPKSDETVPKPTPKPISDSEKLEKQAEAKPGIQPRTPHKLAQKEALPDSGKKEISAPAVQNLPAQKSSTSKSQNRYIILILGAVMLLILSKDIKLFMDKQKALPDKKINNLAVLILALLIVALIYWL